MRSNRLNLATAATVLTLIAWVAGCHKDESQPPKPGEAQVAGASEEHYLQGQAAPVKFVAAAHPATKPTNTMMAGATCITAECHATMAIAPHIHSPVSLKSCGSCHEDDIGGHVFPLKRKGNATCTFCHAVSGTQTHQHKALEQGCVSCHQPHASNAKFLLKFDTVERVCASCHNVPLKKHAHEPFAKGDCSACHQAHQSQFASLLRGGEKSEHCFSCHADMKTKMASASKRHAPAVEDCKTCHNPHATDFPEQLKSAVDVSCYACHERIKEKVAKSPVAHGAMTTAKQCANCHDPHASSDKSLLKARADRMCLSCHDKPIAEADGHVVANMKPVLMNSKFLHGPNKDGNCSACHDPHGGMRAELLKGAFPNTFYTRFATEKYELCFGCHDRSLVLTPKSATLTNFRDGDVNLHYLHVNREDKGRSCKTCHNVHGSDLPNHIASGVPFEGSKWEMPMGYEKTANGGSCSPGCHTTKSYDRTKPIAATRPTTRGVS